MSNRDDVLGEVSVMRFSDSEKNYGMHSIAKRKQIKLNIAMMFGHLVKIKSFVSGSLKFIINIGKSLSIFCSEHAQTCSSKSCALSVLNWSPYIAVLASCLSLLQSPPPPTSSPLPPDMEFRARETFPI